MVNATGGYGIYTDGGSVTVTDAEITAFGTSEDDSEPKEAIKAKKIELTDATVIAQGTNGIYATDGNLTIEGCEVNATATGENGYGLFAFGGLTVTDGTINATGAGTNAAIHAENGDITLTDADINAMAANAYVINANSGVLTITGGHVMATAADENGSGIYAGGDIDISGESGVNAYGNQYGIYSGSDIIISGGEVTATGTTEQGIYATDNINIVKSDEAESLMVNATGGYGIYTDGGSVTVKDAEITAIATSEDASKAKEAIKAKEIGLTDATVFAQGTNGIYATDGNLTIKDCQVEATATGENGYGLFALSALTVTSGTIYATGAGTNAAIHAESGDITLTDADITATAEKAYAINANSSALIITGGHVEATAADENGSGLYASGDIDISGESGVNAYGNQYGIYSGTNVIIGDGQVTATGIEEKGICANDDIIISWADKENDFITASSYEGTIIVDNDQHFRAVSDDKTIAFISGTLDKDNDVELITSLGGTTLTPFETTGYVVTVIGDDLTADGTLAGENDDTETKFYVYDIDAIVTVAYAGDGIVKVTGMDVSDNHTFTMPAEDVILTSNVLDNADFTLANSSVDYNATAQVPGIKYDNADFSVAYYTLTYTKEGQSTPTSQVQNPGNYAVTLTGKGAYIGTVDIDEKFLINPSLVNATTLYASGSRNLWMTWCGTEELVTPEDVTVYTVSGISDSSVALEELDDEIGTASFGTQTMKVIPAYTPVIIYRETVSNDALYGMFNAEGEGESGVQTAEGTTGCAFYGTTMNLPNIPTANYIAGRTYILRGDKFIKADTNEGIAANKCWLVTATNGARQLSIVIGDGTTAIDNGQLTIDNWAGAEEWYTIDGRKLNGKPTKKGLYINNGKKTVIK